MSDHSNSSRILSELVSLEAWHKPLEVDAAVPFHVALAFGDARYSSGDNAPIDFRVRLKRATLVVVCDDGLQVPRGTKRRVHPPIERTVRDLERGRDRRQVTDGLELRAKGTASLMGDAAAELETTGRDERTKEREAGHEREVIQKLRQDVKLNYREVGTEHHWDCAPISGDMLVGPAHDGETPLFEIKPKVDKRLEDLGVRVFIKCKADDFEITDIEVRKSIIERFRGENLERRKNLAKEVIKEKLAEANLGVVELSPRFQEVVIADILAIPE